MKASFKQKFKDALQLFAIFFKIGLFSFGGGYAMLTMIEREVVDKHGWMTKAELQDMLAIAESTPGAIAINIATFIGTVRAGILGGIFTTLGVVLPSFLIILGVSYVIDIVRDNVWIGYVFKGIRVGVLALIARAVLSFYRDMKKDWFNILLLLAGFSLAFFTDISVIYIILGSIVLCILALTVKNLRIKKLHIITDPDAYQRKVCEDAENAKAAAETAVKEEAETSAAANDASATETSPEGGADAEAPDGIHGTHTEPDGGEDKK